MKIYFLFSLLMAGLGATAQECTFRLTGHVHSTASHENLPRATVMLDGRERPLVTDANGDFRFDSLCPGNYTLRITHVSYDTLVRSFTLARSEHLDLDLVPLKEALASVTVTGVRAGTRTGTIGELSGRTLDETKGRSFAEALSRINGVSLLQTGATIAKPVVHGLHGNRLLTINNGIRQEGQQWGNEHAPEIDLFIANRLSVIKGAEEVRYGSDAIGGVILVEPRALRSTPGHGLEVNTVYFTNNRQYVASAIWEQQLRKHPAWTYRLQGTFKRGANVRAPEYRLNNTAMREGNGSLTLGYRREHFRSELYYSFFGTEVGIFSGSHIGNLSDLQRAIAADRPDPTFTGQRSYRIGRPKQEAVHHLAKSKTTFDLNNHRIHVLLGMQYNGRKEYDVVRNASAAGPQLDLSVFTFSEELSWEPPKKGGFSGTVGLVAAQQDNSYSGRYLIPNYRSYAWGGYVVEKWAKDGLELQAGLRFDRKDLTTRRLQAASGTFTSYQFEFNTLAASLNAAYQLTKGWRTGLTLSRSTRAPHVNELLTNGIHHGTGTYEVGNIGLRPERSFNISWNQQVGTVDKRLQAELTLYRNSIDHFIYQQPRPDEPVFTIRGAFPKIVYESTDALLQGADLSVVWQPVKAIGLTSRYSLLRARNRSTDDWLIGMPADRYTQEVTWTLNDGKRLRNSYVSLEWQTVRRQTRVPGDRNGRQDYAPPPPGYGLLHADLSTTLEWKGMPLTFHLSGRNLLNKTYRDYLNFQRYFADEMGRNISLRIQLNLQRFYSNF